MGLLLLLFEIPSASAVDARHETVWLLSSAANSDHQSLIAAMRRGLAAAPHLTLRVVDTATAPDALKSLNGPEQPALIVTVGSAAARLTQTLSISQPVLHTLIPSLLYEQFSPVGHARSALYIDQPFDRQLQLCRLVLPKLRRLAVLYGPSSRMLHDRLRETAQNTGIELVTQQVAAGTNPNAALDKALDDSQLLLALPDPDVFTRYTVAGLLLTAYHHGVPVVGFSAAYVKAGALVAVYSTPEQIGRAAAEILLDANTRSGWNLPMPSHPKYFNVTVNRQVARSLNLSLPEDSELQRALERGRR